MPNPKPPPRPLILIGPTSQNVIEQGMAMEERGRRGPLSETSMTAAEAILEAHPEVKCALVNLYTPRGPSDPAVGSFDSIHTAMCVQDDGGMQPAELLDFLDKLVPALVTLRLRVAAHPDEFTVLAKKKSDA